MREGLWRPKKGGPNKSQEVPRNPNKSNKVKKCQRMEHGRWARWCATVRKQFFPGDHGRNGAQIEKMPF